MFYNKKVKQNKEKMAKFEEPFEDTQNLFNQVIDAAGLSNYINITVLADNKAKEIFKVVKANDLLKFRTGDDVVIVLNEKIFDQLIPAQQRIVAEEALASIGYDTENDKLVISKPDFIAHSGILQKHTYPVIEVVRESIKTLYQAESQEEEEGKQTTK